MKTIPDYSIVKVSGKTVLCIGGAMSLDRFDREQEILNRKVRHKKELSTYWKDEFPIFNQDLLSEITALGIVIDTIITHSAPDFCYPLAKGNLARRIIHDPSLEKDIKMEREVLSKIYNKLIADGHHIQDWLYGHFHTSHIEFISGVRYRLLDIDELIEII
ncbi:hypothetical protein JGH11_14050 [Dysgonomonas sp. Marseille-P4677]|nr:hypothetical protein [Dysgonomonas sp. Marseille-P4677]